MRPTSLLFPAAAAFSLAAAETSASVTFHRNIVPILQARCQGCHRPGEIAPMALRTYDEVRPWVKAIKDAVIKRKMPPWTADPKVGKFQNDASLTNSEIATLTAWADGGAPEGEAKDAPPARKFTEGGWTIGQPHLVIEMPKEYEVPPIGTIEYTYMIVPTGFREDRWVERIEVRPGNRSVVHHVTLYARPPESNWLREYPVGEAFVPERYHRRPGTSTGLSRGSALDGEIIGSFAPGRSPTPLVPGQARLIPANSDLILQLHYTANGKPAKDRTKIGIIFASQPPVERVLRTALGNRQFAIPPGASDHPVEADWTVLKEFRLISLGPHMHVRGKAMEVHAVYPTGEREVLVRVPRYDFNWQINYAFDKPRTIPAGTRFLVLAKFDNSPNNPSNPDPTAEVRWGDQTWEEMMHTWVEAAFEPAVDLTKVFAPTGSLPSRAAHGTTR